MVNTIPCFSRRKQSNRHLVLMRIVIAGIILMIFQEAGFAQETEGQNSRFQVGVDFLVGFPQGDFRDNVRQNGIGVSGLFLYHLIPSAPLHAGMSMGFVEYGRERRREPFSQTIPDVEVDVITANDILLWHGIVRIQSSEGKFRPYTSVLLGGSYLSTTTTIQSTDFTDEEDEIARDTNFDDFVFSYGITGGLQIRLGKWQGSDMSDFRGNRPDTQGSLEFLLDISGRYIQGNRAEYLKEGSIQRSDGEITFDVSSSRTDLLLFQVGVVFRF